MSSKKCFNYVALIAETIVFVLLKNEKKKIEIGSTIYLPSTQFFSLLTPDTWTTSMSLISLTTRLSTSGISSNYRNASNSFPFFRSRLFITRDWKQARHFATFEARKTSRSREWTEDEFHRCIFSVIYYREEADQASSIIYEVLVGVDIPWVGVFINKVQNSWQN